MTPNSLNRPDLNADTLAKVKNAVAHASASVAKTQARAVPTVFRSSLKVEWFRHFSFKERLQILFGCNLLVLTGIATQHNPGKFQPLIMGRVSYQKNATGHMQTVVDNMLEEQKPKIPLENQP